MAVRGRRLADNSPMADNDTSHSSAPAEAPGYLQYLQAGNALVAQAQAVATADFAQARALWQAAGREFFRAHQADKNQPEAAFRLAQAWMAEAHALQKESSPNAALMWANAAAQCEQAFDLEPSNGRIAMTAASCHHFAGQNDAAKAWQQIGQHLLPPQADEG